jgi:hypothetical protein
VFASEDGVRAHFNGIYRNLRTQWESVDGQSGASTDSWGNVSLNLARMVKGVDMMVPSGWYQCDYRHENRSSTYRRVNFVWDFLYETINQSNIIIEGVSNSDFAESSKNALIAEARAIRAWAYFDLIREFEHTYTADVNALGVPIYTEPASIESVGNNRGTVQEVYNLIAEGLEFAVANLDPGGSRVLKSNINVNVAYGLLARVKLEMGAWQDAKNAAIAARSGYALNATAYEDFSDDVVMMRVAEMYLIEAEAKAELGEADAGDMLFELQSNRDPNAVKSGNTGQDLVDEILVERRKELYGEIGVSFLDIKRRQIPLVRTGNHPEAYKFNFPSNSENFILRIPQREIDSNVNITESDQND